MLAPTTDHANSVTSIRFLILLVLLYLLLPVQALLPIDDPDVWWRLRVGEWIVQNHAAPFIDYYSAYDIGRPWIEYSWLFALVIYEVYSHWGLVGIVWYIVSMAVAISIAVHQLIRRAGLPIFAEVAFAGFALAAMKPVMTPRPWLFTIFFFAVELVIIERFRCTGRNRYLWFLPPLFVVWANSHIQFVYGLAAIFLLAIEGPLAIGLRRLGWHADTSAPQRHAMLVAMACLAATLLTPFHLLLYKQILDYVGGQTRIFQNITELHPMFFRSPGDWLVLFLALSAAFALGWRRAWMPYPILLLLLSALWAFRARRDVWALVLVAISIISESARTFRNEDYLPIGKTQIALCATAVAAVLLAVSAARGIAEKNLQQAVRDVYPVEAVNYVKQNGLSGPLFNDYDWGGFFIWSLPSHPVVMDGRVQLYGDEKFERSLNTWSGGKGWETDPDLLRAKVIIAKSDKQLTNLLRANAKYRVVYEDKVAVVFVAAN